jgi:error-prone DNA polymerase
MNGLDSISSTQHPNILLAHTHFSFLQGASSPAEVLRSAYDQGWNGILWADFDGVYGLPQAHMQNKNMTKTSSNQSLKMAYGAEILLEPQMPEEGLTQRLPQNHDWNDPGSWWSVAHQPRVALMAHTLESYHELCRLISYVHRHGKKATPLAPNDTEAPWPKHCKALLPCRGLTQLFHAQEERNYQNWKTWVQQLASQFDVFHLALTLPSSPAERNAYSVHMRAQIDFDVPLVATQDVFFHSETRKPLHDTLTAIRCNATRSETQWACFPNSERHISSAKDFISRHSKNELLRNALNENFNYLNDVQFSMSDIRYRYPNEFLPEGKSSMGYLNSLIDEALKKRYGLNVPPKIRTLIEKEIKLVEELQFADYFLTVYDIVRFARSQKILCQGRGSSANSTICFLLGITAVDPMVSDLLFERFISRERGEPPDIDVDFEHERREEVIQYIYQRYGRSRAAMVANVITFQKRGCIRYVGKTFGFNENTLTQLLSVFSDRLSYKQSPQEVLAQGREALALHNTQLSDDDICMWAEHARLLKGFPRHLGIHSGGFVISQDPLDHMCPTEPATMQGRSVVQWNKDDLESLGLFKIDILSLGMLTCVRKTLQSLAANGVTLSKTRIPLNYENIPPECPKTYAMIQQAETYGTFQIESRAQMSMLPKVLPKTFYDLVVQVGIVRPGPIVAGMATTYVRRKMGLEKIDYPHPALKEILHRTMGVPIFQEQVMRVAMNLGNFTPGEADELRRSMGAWKFTGDLKKFENKLREGMSSQGVPSEFADQIFKFIEGFSQYGFPESHATSFAHIAYVSSYLKAHFPNHFLAGLINSQPLGFYSNHTLIQQARNEGVEVLPPCIVHSQWDCFIQKGGQIRLGFRIIRSLNKETLACFLNKRRSLEELNHLCEKLSIDEIEPLMEGLMSTEQSALALAGAFDLFDRNRRNILWRLLALKSKLLDDITMRCFQSNSTAEELWEDAQDDFETKKTSQGKHPLQLIKEQCWPYSWPISKLTPSNRLSLVPHGRTVTIAGLLIVRQSPPTAKGVTFLSLEDERGMFNVIVSQVVYLKYRDVFLKSSFICLKGTKQTNGSAATVLAIEAYSPDH